MFYALDRNGYRVSAQREVEAVCPVCGDPVVARCGDVNQWHWAHRQREECDPWFESETAWHLGWKALAPPERTEVAMGEHRADIVARDGLVIELQHSSISMEEIAEREAFYDQMVWLLDGSTFAGNFRVSREGKLCRFHWSPARPTWLAARKFLFIHGFSFGTLTSQPAMYGRRIEPKFHSLGTRDDVFQILEMSSEAPHLGIGRIIPVEAFVERLVA